MDMPSSGFSGYTGSTVFVNNCRESVLKGRNLRPPSILDLPLPPPIIEV